MQGTAPSADICRCTTLVVERQAVKDVSPALQPAVAIAAALRRRSATRLCEIRATGGRRRPDRLRAPARPPGPRRRGRGPSRCARPARRCPPASTRKVERSIPMKFRPYIDFSPQTPKRSNTSPVSSESRITPRPCLSRNRSWLFTLSLEMPRTAVLAASKSASRAVKSRASSGAARGVVLRVEVEHELAPAEVGGPGVAAAVAGQGEVGDGLAGFDRGHGALRARLRLARRDTKPRPRARSPSPAPRLYRRAERAPCVSTTSTTTCPRS